MKYVDWHRLVHLCRLDCIGVVRSRSNPSLTNVPLQSVYHQGRRKEFFEGWGWGVGGGVVLRIDNSGRSVICAIGLISETVQSRITCDTSNNRAYFSVSFYVNNIIIILD